MQKPFTIIFGGIIAFILLAIYSLTVLWILINVIKSAQTETGEMDLSTGLIYVVTTIGGLVSALVVSKLAITKPGENPAAMRIAADSEGKQSTTVTRLVVLYLTVWVLVGLAALVVGVMFYPDTNQTLSDIGTTWLGLAVASGYAYFGIEP